jgi:HPt (histidine-containing phosphotransfer) domain-containing protein
MSKKNHHRSTSRQRANHRQYTTTTINLEYLHELADGDQHFIIEVIEMFVTDAPVVLKQSITYHKAANYPLLKVGVHKLKSSIKMMGDEGLATLAQDIENHCLDESMQQMITPQLFKFVMGVNRLLESLKIELQNLRSRQQTNSHLN